MRECPYINVSGAAINSNKTASFFEINAPQYMSHYKHNRTLSFLPIQAHFNSTKYKTKKPIPSNNTYVSIEGFLEDLQTDSSGRATMFHVSMDNINFLGRASLSPSGTGNPSLSSHYISFSIFIPSLQHLQRPHALRVSSSSSTRLLAHLPMPLFKNHPLPRRSRKSEFRHKEEKGRDNASFTINYFHM